MSFNKEDKLYVNCYNLSGRYIFLNELYDNKLRIGYNLNLDLVNNKVIYSFNFDEDFINIILCKYDKVIKYRLLYLMSDDLHDINIEEKEFKQNINININENKGCLLEYDDIDDNDNDLNENNNYDFYTYYLYYTMPAEYRLINKDKKTIENDLKTLRYIYEKNFMINSKMEMINDYYKHPEKYRMNIFYNIFSIKYYILLKFLYIRFYNQLDCLKFKMFNNHIIINFNDNKINFDMFIFYHLDKINFNCNTIKYISIYKINENNNYELLEKWILYNENSNIYYCFKLYFNKIYTLFSTDHYINI